MAKYIKTEEGYKDLEESVSKIVDPVKAELSNKMNKTNPTGTGSFSLNRKAGTTIGTNSFAEGYNTTASGDFSHAEGQSTKATSTDDSISVTPKSTKGLCTHAEGYGTVAYGRCSHAEGNGTKASGNDSHAEGKSTTASKDCSHAEGSGTTASEYSSHAEGVNTTASGYASHAEGYYTTASGSYSHAEGYHTTASGSYSHAEGYHTTASGSYSSHAEGSSTKASSAYQHAQGKYNIEDTSNTYAHIVGNGTSTARSNAHTLDWNGNAWYQGDVYVGGTNQTTGSKKLATEEYVDEAVPDLSGFATKDEIPVVPEALPNPNALTFTGAVNAVYDGSEAVSVEIPSGGSGGGKQEKIIDITFDEEFNNAEISIDLNGNQFKLSEFTLWFKTAIVTSGSYNYFRIAVNENSNTENLPNMNAAVSTSFRSYGYNVKIRQDGTIYATFGDMNNLDYSNSARFTPILGLASSSNDDSKIVNYGEGVYKFNISAIGNIFAVGTRLIVYGVRA